MKILHNKKARPVKLLFSDVLGADRLRVGVDVASHRWTVEPTGDGQANFGLGQNFSNLNERDILQTKLLMDE